jgi:hypothetical protein
MIDRVSIRAAVASLSLALLLAGQPGQIMANDSAGLLRISPSGQASNLVGGPSTIRSSESDSAGGAFEIRWQTIDGGAALATVGNYQLRGTVGQPDADADHPAQGTEFAHLGGFWAVLPGRGESVSVMIFRDRFEP